MSLSKTERYSRNMLNKSKLNAALKLCREKGIRQVSTEGICHIGSLLYPTTNIFDRDWDLMIVLDACRLDLMCEVEQEFEFIQSVDYIYSVGSKTTEWMRNTFSKKYSQPIKDTTYVCGNPNSNKHLEPSMFGRLDEVWRYGWDDQVGALPPEPVTDKAISLSRTQDQSKMLLHYMQPHEPFLASSEFGGKDSAERIAGFSDGQFNSIWSRLEDGQVDESKVWEAYRENLRLILDNIRVLVNNIDAEKVVITSDHGNAFGEYGIYGHPANRPIPQLIKVPWIELSASDSGQYSPKKREYVDESNLKSKLRDLGYA
ncbi:PglZ domain-containing protein [Haloferax prahovense]|uniref:PglZ domain-containing protein n=1 Tax=Haloferax prahovense TaxID=381852 RepID=UPI003C71C44A